MQTSSSSPFERNTSASDITSPQAQPPSHQLVTPPKRTSRSSRTTGIMDDESPFDLDMMLLWNDKILLPSLDDIQVQDTNQEEEEVSISLSLSHHGGGEDSTSAKSVNSRGGTSSSTSGSYCGSIKNGCPRLSLKPRRKKNHTMTATNHRVPLLFSVYEESNEWSAHFINCTDFSSLSAV